MKVLIFFSLYLITMVVSADSMNALEKESWDKSKAMHDPAMDIIGARKCRNMFREYMKTPTPKAFAYTVDPRGYYGQCNMSVDQQDADKIALELCNKARNKSKYITKFSPECKLLAVDYKLMASMQDFKLKPKIVDLEYAIQRRDLSTIKKLVDDGADIKKINSYKSTPFLTAVREGRKDVAEYLLELGSNINHTQQTGYGALSMSIVAGYDELFNFLIDKGADKEITIKKTGKKLIHFAGESGRKEIVEKLISLGDDINVPDNNGITALHYAVDATNLKAVKMLVAMGANINARTRTGKTPLDFTKRKKKLEIAAFLKKQKPAKKLTFKKQSSGKKTIKFVPD